MTQDEAHQIIKAMMAAWPNHRWPDPTIATYAQALTATDADYATIRTAVATAVANEATPPPIAKLLAAGRAHTAEWRPRPVHGYAEDPDERQRILERVRAMRAEVAAKAALNRQARIEHPRW